MNIILAALILSAVTGFLAGTEYDRMRRIAARNRRLRREENARKRKAAMARRQVAEDQRKFDYMYSIQFDGPKGK